MKTTLPDFSAGTHNCAGEAEDVFFDGLGRHAFDYARFTCEGCPLQDECFAYALTNDVDGFWGGTSEPERNKMRKLLGMRPISIEASYITLFPSDTPYVSRVMNVADRAAEKWDDLPLEDALAARDLVLEQVADARADRAGRAEVLRTYWQNTRGFTDEQVREIRASEESNSVLAERFGVSDTTISKVRKRQRYADVLDDAEAVV